jgi:hypothetical protein
VSCGLACDFGFDCSSGVGFSLGLGFWLPILDQRDAKNEEEVVGRESGLVSPNSSDRFRSRGANWKPYRRKHQKVLGLIRLHSLFSRCVVLAAIHGTISRQLALTSLLSDRPLDFRTRITPRRTAYSAKVRPPYILPPSLTHLLSAGSPVFGPSPEPSSKNLAQAINPPVLPWIHDQDIAYRAGPQADRKDIGLDIGVMRLRRFVEEVMAI